MLVVAAEEVLTTMRQPPVKRTNRLSEISLVKLVIELCYFLGLHKLETSVF